MRTIELTHAAGDTDPGLQRQVNEDRFHLDVARGVFFVVDGIGGQAAGGKAADVAVAMLRKRLERETGPVAARIREAIAVANNEICRMAGLRSEWHGMACVLTVAVIEGDRATIGHVGDTRLYKLRGERIEKVTHDHSPIGEREDARELSESEAMKHPRRNEVYRDVGSEPHEPGDPEFVDIQEIPFESDAALLICSDGLSDLVPSASIAQVVSQFAGDSSKVTRALIDAANDAGGKDNVTVVYVEGEDFAQANAVAQAGPAASSFRRRWRVARVLRYGVVAALALAAGFALGWAARPRLLIGGPAMLLSGSAPAGEDQVVGPSESIMAAIARAQPGSEVIVEPGEYREQLVLRDGVRLVSRVARGATLRLPPSATESEAAVVATELAKAEISGFRIVGDAATPLGTGILVQNAGLTIVDVEISGATKAAVDFSGARDAALIGSEIHENPGAAIAVRSGSAPRIAQNSFGRNGLSEASQSLVVEPGASPRIHRNLFHGISVDAFGVLDQASRQALMRGNLFLSAATPRSLPRDTGRGR